MAALALPTICRGALVLQEMHVPRRLEGAHGGCLDGGGWL